MWCYDLVQQGCNALLNSKLTLFASFCRCLPPRLSLGTGAAVSSLQHGSVGRRENSAVGSGSSSSSSRVLTATMCSGRGVMARRKRKRGSRGWREMGRQRRQVIKANSSKNSKRSKARAQQQQVKQRVQRRSLLGEEGGVSSSDGAPDMAPPCMTALTLVPWPQPFTRACACVRACNGTPSIRFACCCSSCRCVGLLLFHCVLSHFSNHSQNYTLLSIEHSAACCMLGGARGCTLPGAPREKPAAALEPWRCAVPGRTAAMCTDCAW